MSSSFLSLPIYTAWKTRLSLTELFSTTYVYMALKFGVLKIAALVAADAVAVNTANLTEGLSSALISPTCPYHFLNGVPCVVSIPQQKRPNTFSYLS